jgi:hypothetical protein
MAALSRKKGQQSNPTERDAKPALLSSESAPRTPNSQARDLDETAKPIKAAKKQEAIRPNQKAQQESSIEAPRYFAPNDRRPDERPPPASHRQKKPQRPT